MKKFFAILVLLMFLNTALAAEFDNGGVSPREIGRSDDRARAFGEGPDDFKRGPEGFGPGPKDDFGPFGGPPGGDFGPGRGPNFDDGPRGPERERFKARENYGPRIPDFSKRPDGIYGMAFQYIDDEINEEELFPLCGEPEKIADLLVGKIKEKVGGDVSTVCNEFPVAECTQRVEEGCNRIGKPPEEFFEDASELEKKEMTARTCPVSGEETFVELCKERSKQWLETRREVISDQEFCEQEFSRRQPRDFQDEPSERVDRVERVERRSTPPFESQERMRDEVSQSEPTTGIQESESSETKTSTIDSSSSSSSTETNTGGGATNSATSGNSANSATSGSSSGTGTSTDTNSASTSPSGVTGSAIAEQKTLGQSLLRIITGAAAGLGLVEESSTGSGGEGSGSGAGSPVSGDATSTGGGSGSSNQEQPPQGDFGRGTQDNFRQDDFRQDQMSPENKERFDRESRESRRDFEREDRRRPPIDEFMDDSVREEPSEFESFRPERRGPSKDEMLKECIDRQKEEAENPTHCKVEAKIEAKRQTQMCTRFEKEQKKCKERNTQMCKKLEEVQTLCKEKMNEQSLREFILREAKRRCAFAEVQDELSGPEESQGYIALLTLSEDSTVKDIEGLEISMGATLDRYRAIRDSIVYGAKYESKDEATKAGQLAAKFSGSVVLGVDVVKDFREGESAKQKDLRKRLLLAAKRLESAKGGDFGGVAQTQDIVEAAQELKSQEEGKGTVYKFLKFFGAKKEQELREAKTLEEKNSKIDELVKELENEIADEQDPVLATILGEEIETLKKQKEELNTHIEEKKDDAGGIFG